MKKKSKKRSQIKYLPDHNFLKPAAAKMKHILKKLHKRILLIMEVLLLLVI